MKWIILNFCFLCFLSSELVAQNEDKPKHHIDNTMVPTQVEDIPVLTDVIVVPAIGKDVIYPESVNAIGLMELVKPIRVQDAVGQAANSGSNMGDFNESDDYFEANGDDKEHYCKG